MVAWHLNQTRIRLLVYCLVLLLGIILLQFSLYGWYPAILQAIGGSLIAASATTTLFELILRDETLNEMKKELRSPIRELGVGQAVASVYKDAFLRSRDRIDVMGLSFLLGFKNYGDQILNKIVNEYCKIRVLIPDPESPAIELRIRDEPDRDAVRLRKNITETIAACKALETKFHEDERFKKAPKGSFEVRMHKSLPYRGYSRMDEACFVVPYLAYDYGLNSPVIQIDADKSVVFQPLAKSFEVVWERADSTQIVEIGLLHIRKPHGVE